MPIGYDTSIVPKATLDHYAAIPWVSSHLSDPAFHPVHLSRTLTHSGTGHTLMATTWNTPDTIEHILSIYRPPSTDGDNLRGEIRRFYTFGHGLNAHPNILHGGVAATILDSTMGNVIGQQIPNLKGAIFTARLTVEYKKPVATPGTIIARAWIRSVDGRKIFVEGVIEDKNGIIHAKGDGMWIQSMAKGKL
jgi:acyl-coenzyme A thioesterase PaaI-like protein